MISFGKAYFTRRQNVKKKFKSEEIVDRDTYLQIVFTSQEHALAAT